MMEKNNSLSERNLTMLVDFYEMTMANGYLKSGMGDTIAYFDMFFRTVPDSGGYVIMAGVEQLCEYLKNLSFSKRDIEYLRGRGFHRNSSNILKISSLPAMSMPCRRALRFFPVSRS